jgi:membrane protease YdiL (CAAX protease family)
MDDITGDVGIASARLTPTGAPDARAPALSPGARVVDALRFVVRPVFAARPMAWGWQTAPALLVLLALTLAACSLLHVALEAINSRAAFLPARTEAPIISPTDLIGPVLFAPLLEELVFRSWLSGRVAALRFVVYIVVAVAILIANYIVTDGEGSWLGLVVIAIVCAGLLHWFLTRKRDAAVPEWFISRFHWIVWGSTLLFGLVHLGNHAALTNPFGILVVLPQTIGGLLLAYVRTRLGFGAAVIHHSAFNTVWFGAGMIMA